MKPSIIALFAALFAAPIGGGALADDAPPVPAIFTIIPQSGLQALQGKVRFVGTFEPSGSTWTDGLDERDVFLAAMEGEGWRIGIGKGGQLYSVRGPFGESVPPQRLDSPWNDEVWQMVLTVEEIIRPIHDFQKQGREQRMATMPLMYFIHQSGIYVKGQSDGIDSGSVARPFYSPVLRQHWDPSTRTFHVVNWAQQARTPCVWKSGALIYTSYRDLGGGALEVTQVLHHFGDQTITYINAPWGGVRHSALPHAILSKPDGTWEEVEGGWGADTALRKLRDTLFRRNRRRVSRNAWKCPDTVRKRFRFGPRSSGTDSSGAALFHIVCHPFFCPHNSFHETTHPHGHPPGLRHVKPGSGGTRRKAQHPLHLH